MKFHPLDILPIRPAPLIYARLTPLISPLSSSLPTVDDSSSSLAFECISPQSTTASHRRRSAPPPVRQRHSRRSKNVTMEDNGPSRENLTWTEPQMDYLVQLLVEQSRMPDMKSGGGLKPKAYTTIEKNMMKRFGPEFTKDKIKNKLKYSKPNLSVMKEMLNTSGFGYDPINKCIEVDPQKYPNKKKYRGPKLWRYCDEFTKVYGESLATGKDAVTLNNILHDDNKPLPSTSASQTTPLYMQPDSEQSFTQMLNDDSPLQSPVPPTPTTENSTNNTTTRRSKRNRSNSSNDDVYYNFLNSIAQNMDTLAHTCRGFQYVKCCKILQEMVDSGLLDSHTRLMSMDLLVEGTNSMIFVNIPPSDRSIRLMHSSPNLSVMKEMLNTSGFGYDPINKCIEVDPQKYPNKKKYRGPKLWRYCDEFAEVYGEFLATGKDAVTLNNILHDDTKPLPSTPASQTTPLYMQPDSEQSFTQMLNDDSPLQSPVPPTPTTENSTNNTTTRRSKRNRSNSSNDDVYYNLLNSIAQNMDTLAHTCRGFQYVKCCKILQEMVDSGLLDSHTRLMSMDLLAEGTNSMIFVNIPPSDREWGADNGVMSTGMESTTRRPQTSSSSITSLMADS
ncbi:hypothetical protein EJ110_NYTH35401 [Nymphaea thermarum]|nr:hypothetical protein EJ110_NYTH35401 [Nymphaea thermarum]